jgi:hypothetical protein
MKRTKKWTKSDNAGSPPLDLYEVGDRVVLLDDLNGILAGTKGNVVKGTTSEYFAVQWEETAFPRGMYPEEIELVKSEETPDE